MTKREKCEETEETFTGPRAESYDNKSSGRLKRW